MMTSVLIAIAMLCQINVGTGAASKLMFPESTTKAAATAVVMEQKACHQFYSGCIQKKVPVPVTDYDRALLQCMQERP